VPQQRAPAVAFRVLLPLETAATPPRAARRLRVMIAQTLKLGFIPYEFDARLALGEVETESGRATAGRTHLADLETEARGKGSELVARQAGALASKA